jgi:hypothetical protein
MWSVVQLTMGKVIDNFGSGFRVGGFFLLGYGFLTRLMHLYELLRTKYGINGVAFQKK